MLKLSLMHLSFVVTHRDLCTISIFCHNKAKTVGKAQFTNVNEHVETFFNAGMAEKTTHATVSHKKKN